MGKKPRTDRDRKDKNPLKGLEAYLEEHKQDSIFDRENGSESAWCLFLHGGKEAAGRIKDNETYEFNLVSKEGSLEKTHKVHVHYLCPESMRDQAMEQRKKDDAVAGKSEGPHFVPRFRHHIKNKSLFPLMNRREVLFFTLLGGDVLRGIITGFSRHEINFSMKGGVPVVIMRHAVFDVKDKKDRSFLKKEVEKTGQYW